MHEISICQSIIDAVEHEYPHPENVREIHLKIGGLSCLEPSYMEQVYHMMVEDTVLQDSCLTFERTRVKAKCDCCGKEFAVVDFVFICPVCNTPSADIIEGDELEISYVVIEEPSCREISQKV